MSRRKPLDKRQPISYTLSTMNTNNNIRFESGVRKEHQFIGSHSSQSLSFGWGLRFLSSWTTLTKRSSWRQIQHNKTVYEKREPRPVPASNGVKPSCNKRTYSVRHCSHSIERMVKPCTTYLRTIRNSVFSVSSGAASLTDLRRSIKLLLDLHTGYTN